MIRVVPEDNDALYAGPKRLGAIDLDMAPDTPGIYAWYAQLGLADDDWRPYVRGEIDLAGGYLIKAVADYARLHQPNPIHLSGDGAYRLDWSGTLRRSSIADTTPGTEATDVDTRLASLADEPGVRQLLLGLLRTAVPVFASPLYIGVATNLRTRLADHIAAYENARARLRSDPSAAARMQFDGNSFGERLAATGLQLEYLQCWILPANLESADASSGESSITSARTVAEAAEWILQRIFLPVLGRQ